MIGDDNAQFRLLLEAISDYAIYMLDPNGVVTNWNRGAQNIKGYAPGEALGRHFSIFYTPEDRAAGLPAHALGQALRHGRFEAEGWRVRKDGSRFWASVVIDAIRDDDDRHIGFAKITRDVTERRTAELALAQSERQFRLLVASVVDYAIFMLDPNGVVANWNAGAEQIKGYAASEIVGRHFSTFYTEADRAAGTPTRALETALSAGRFDAEGWRVRKDGSLFWASVVIDPVRDEQGELIGFAKITRDMTERREAQLDRQRGQQRLAQAQKMEAIGQLTGGVAHDFNNLLMVIGGHAQLLRSHLAQDARALRALDAIELAARRGQDLTRHLLTFARRQRLTPRPTSLIDTAAALGEVLNASVGSTMRVEIDLPADLWTVEVDPGELELALLNLAVNARDAAAGAGLLTVSAENVTHDGQTDAEELHGDFVALSVSDDGQGIPPDILSRVFEPFFTTKDVNKGTGLGLSQVYGFAQQSGGRATVESELGQGARFTIYLPRSGRRPVTPREPTSAHLVREARILVVEDNPEVAEVAASLLEQLGNHPRVVGSAEAALAALAQGEPTDLVFSDIVMAGSLDGLGLARKLRAERPDLPILLATGYSQASENIAEEFPILAKPYALADLSRALGKLLAPQDATTEA
jgi:PAS domain S-box-containing protein